MADRIVKPDSGNDLVLQNDDASAKIEINEDGSIPVTGTLAGSVNVSSGTLTTSTAQKQAIVQAGPGSGTLDVSSGTLTTSSAQKQTIVQAGPGSGTLDVSSGTLTTSTAQKQAIVDGATIEAQDLASGSGTSLPNNVQDAITRLGTVTSGTFNGTLGGSITYSMDNGDIPRLKVDAFGEYVDISIGSGVQFGIHTMSFAGESLIVLVSTPGDSTNYLYAIAMGRYDAGGSQVVATWGNSTWSLATSGTSLLLYHGSGSTITARVRKIYLTNSSN